MADTQHNPNDPHQPDPKAVKPGMPAEDEVDLMGAANQELHPDSDEEFKPIQLADLEEASSELIGPTDSNAEVDIEQAAREQALKAGQTGDSASSGSGASLVSWGELVQEPQESSAVDLGAAPPVKFDALSDIDIVRKLAQEQTAASDTGETGPGSAAPLPFTLDEPPRPRGPRTTQLAAGGAIHTMLAPVGEVLPKDEGPASAIPLASPVFPAAKAEAPPTSPPTAAAPDSGVLIKPAGKSSKVDLTSDPWVDLSDFPSDDQDGPKAGQVQGDSGVLITPIDESSSVNLGSDPVVALPQSEPPKAKASSQPPRGRPVEDSGVLITPPDESSSVDLGSHMDINILSSGLLGAEESRRGLLPKESSVVNLGGGAGAPTAKPPKRAEDEEEVDLMGAAAAAPDRGAHEHEASDDLLGTQEMPAPSSGIDWDKVPGETTATAEMGEGTEPDERATAEMRLEEEPTDSETEPEEEVEKAAKPVKQRKPRRFVSGLVGAVVGSGLAVGLWTAGLEPPQSWRKEARPYVQTVEPYLKDYTGLELAKVDGQKARPGASDSPGQLSARQHLKTGNAAAALEMLDKSADESNAQDVIARGHARWLNYMQKEPAPRADAPEVQKAIQDLQKYKTPDAYFRLGVIYESTGKLAEARTAYEDGMKATADPKDSRKFQAALHRLDLMAPAAPAGAQSRATVLDLAVLLIALQAPAGGAEEEEAGYKFLEARRAAQAGDFDAARKALAEAKDRHLKRRNLHDSPNPESDPLDTIFAIACDELQAYMDLRGILKDNGYDPKAPTASLKQLASDKKGADDLLAKTLKDAAAKLNIKEEKPDDIIKGITDLADARKKADDELTILRTELTDAKFVSDSQKDLAVGLKALVKASKDSADGKKTAEDKLAKVATQLDVAGIKDPELDKGVDKLAAARDDMSTTIQNMAKKLEAGQFVAPKADKDALLKGIDKAVSQAQQPLVTAVGHVASQLTGVSGIGAGTLQGLDLTGRLAASQAQTAAYLIQIRQSRTPREMLPLWMETLQDSNRKEVVEPAALDAQRVLKDASASPEEKAEAQALEGLVLRNQGKYDEARKALEAAVKVPAQSGPRFCRTEGEKLLKELTDPNAYYLHRAEDLYAAGQLDDALEAVDTGLDVFPKNGQLLALQALVRLDLARKNASKKLTAADVAEAQKDADAAVAAGAVAEGQYAAGLISEATGDLVKAEQRFREALKAHGEADAAGNTYRMALARVLLAPKRRPAPPPEVTGDKVGLAPSNAGQLAPYLALLLVAAQVDADLDAPPPMPEVEEALKLAEEMIKANDYRGHLIKAQALGKKGFWTTALEEYVMGLKHLIRPEYANGLDYIVENHPAFRRPDSLRPPDPLIGEKYFGNGLRFYFDRQYPAAEKELIEAVRYNDQDARYLYYLGLARLMQGKRATALEDFRIGAMLERQNKPAAPAVAGSLERVQGPVRQTLNKYRP